MISKNVLIAFGFRRAVKSVYTSEIVWYNHELEMYYYPKRQTDEQFAYNILVCTLNVGIRRLLIDGIANVVNKILRRSK